MIKYVIAVMLAFGILIVGFSTPASATPICNPTCEPCQTCVYSNSSCFGETCDTDCECTNLYKSRGDCISSQIASNCQDLTGQEKKDCVADAKVFCDCASFNGCTDLPPDPPEGDDDDDDDLLPPLE